MAIRFNLKPFMEHTYIGIYINLWFMQIVREIDYFLSSSYQSLYRTGTTHGRVFWAENIIQTVNLSMRKASFL